MKALAIMMPIRKNKITIAIPKINTKIIAARFV